MTDTFTEDELTSETLPPEFGDDSPDDAQESQQAPNGDGPDLSFLDSPDFADFLKRPKTARARDYEKRTGSLLVTVMMGLIQNPGTVPDAANIIYHGSSVSAAAGILADSDERAAKMLDFLTMPENPYVGFAIAVIPFAAQFFRNHEAAIEAAPARFRASRKARKEKTAPPRTPAMTLTIPILKKKIAVRIPFRFKISVFRASSVPPELLTQTVFSDTKVRRELKKRGVRIGE